MSAAVLFVSIPYSTIKNESFIFSEKDTAVNIVIDNSSFDTAVIINFARSINYQFIFTISDEILNEPGIETIFPGLYTLFCLSGCFRSSTFNIPVLTDNPGPCLSTLSSLKEYFHLQGEQNIEFVIFASHPEIQLKNSILFCSLAQLKLFEKSRNWSPVLVIVTMPDPKRLSDEIISLQTLIKQDKYTKLFFESIALRSQLNRFQQQSTLWKARSELYNSFISLSKKVGETQYYDIITWYQQEYEVLPLWYKRFGHLLKVVVGKRSFKSLFRKDVKKYKD